MAYPPVFSHDWRTWLRKLLRFRVSQCWALEDLVLLSRQRGTPGELHLLDVQIASWLERSLESWQILRDLMIRRGLMRYVPCEDAWGYYEFSEEFCPPQPADTPQNPPSPWDGEPARSFEALFSERGEPTASPPPGVDENGKRPPMTERECKWKERLNAQVAAAWGREITDEEREDWLQGVRQWVADGNPGKEFLWKGFRSGGFVRKNADEKILTNTENPDMTNALNVVVVSQNSKSNNIADNIASQNPDRTNSQNPDKPDPDKLPFAHEAVSGPMLSTLFETLVDFHVTRSVIVQDLLPHYGYERCLRQAAYLRDREGEDKARVYVAAVRGDWEPPAAYTERLEAERAADAVKARRQAEKDRRQREEAEKQELGKRLETFRHTLSEADKDALAGETNRRFQERNPALYQKYLTYRQNKEQVSQAVADAIKRYELAVLMEMYDRQQEEAQAAMAGLAEPLAIVTEGDSP